MPDVERLEFENEAFDIKDAAAVEKESGELANTVVNYDSEETDVSSWTDFITNFISGIKVGKWFKDFKAGVEYVLHVGSLVNNCVTDNSELPLSAAQGKVLMDEITTLNSALTNGSVTKVGTSTVGGTARGIYCNSGTLTACSSTVGSGTQPCYMSSGTITACASTVGSSTKPIYSNAGVLTACSSTVGSSTTPVYMSSGTITACSAMMRLSGDTFTGMAYAYNNTTYATYQLHNIAFTTSVPSSLTNGTICFVYS